MNNATLEPRQSGSKWWGPLFKKKQKLKAITVLAECNSRLTSMVEDQSRLISSLTCENEKYGRMIRDYDMQMTALSENADKLEATIKRLMESKDNQKADILKQSNEIQSLLNEKQELADGTAALARDKDDLNKQLHETERQLEKYAERTEKLQAEIESLRVNNASVVDDLILANQKVHEEMVKNKVLTSDFQETQNDLKGERKRREELEQSVEDLQKSIYDVTMARFESENEKGAVNEILKYEVVTLRRKLERMKKVEEKLRRDKQLILQYYKGITEGNMNAQIVDMQLDHPNNLEGLRDVGYNENEIFTLESRLYRQCKLIEELSDMVRESKPDFNIKESPFLNLYMDDNVTDNDDSFDTSDNTHDFNNSHPDKTDLPTQDMTIGLNHPLSICDSKNENLQF